MSDENKQIEQASNEPEGLDQFLATTPDQQAVTQTPSESNVPEGLEQFIEPELKEAKFGTLGQQAITALEGAAEGIAGPLAPMAEKALGVPAEDILARQEVNPIAHGAGELAGFAGSMASGVGLGAGVAKLGALVPQVAKGAPVLAKVGSFAARSALETAALASSDELTKLVLGDPNQSAETAIADIGLATVLGGGLGAGLGAAGKLWEVAGASKTGQVLKALTKRLGGIEGELADDAVVQAIEKSGLDIAPELRAGLSNEPWAQQWFKELHQTDVNASGKELQKTFDNFRKQAGDTIVRSLGRAPEDVVAMPEISKYEVGKSLGNTLASEYETQVKPLADTFEAYKAKFKDAPLSNIEKDLASANISELAAKEGWTTSPSSDVMKEVNRVLNELPLQKNIKNLSDFITQVGNNTSDFTKPGLYRAGGLMKRTLREAEANAIMDHLGAAEGAEAVEAFKAAREGYRVVSALKDSLDDRLRIKGANTSNFATLLRDMAQTDGEAVLRRLSGTNDASLLEFLDSHYPQTSNLLKNYHLDNLLKTAADKAKGEMTINSEALVKNLKKLSPELRNAIVSPEALERIEAISEVLTKFNEMPHNYSNTGRMLDAAMQNIPGSVTGIITSAVTGNPILGLIVKPLTKALGRDVPDAVKLAILKFLGSTKTIDAVAFKDSVEAVQAVINGEKLLTNSAKNVIKGADKDALPIKHMPTEKDRALIQKQIEKATENPESLMDVGKKVAYYMPEKGTAMSATASSIVNYLDAIRPKTSIGGPLDYPVEPTQDQKAEYENALNLAQQPLLLFNKIKQGTLTSKDITHVKTMYPKLYDRMSQKLLENVVEAKAKKTHIPYQTKMSLSLFLGQPMDSTMTPVSIQSAQMVNTMSGANMSQDQKSKGRPSAPALQKMPDQYRTQSQMLRLRNQRR